MTAVPRSPLADLDLGRSEASGGMRLRELPLGDELELRAGPAARDRLERDLALELPLRPNSWRAGAPDAYWLGPDEWLLVAEPGAGAALEERSLTLAAEAWHSLVDVSDQRTALELSGARAAEILAGGCPVDLHPRAFGVGDCAQTVLAGAGILLALVDAAPTFRLFVRASFAGYVAEWLLDAISGDGAVGRC